MHHLLTRIDEKLSMKYIDCRDDNGIESLTILELTDAAREVVNDGLNEMTQPFRIRGLRRLTLQNIVGTLMRALRGGASRLKLSRHGMDD